MNKYKLDNIEIVNIKYTCDKVYKIKCPVDITKLRNDSKVSPPVFLTV